MTNKENITKMLIKVQTERCGTDYHIEKCGDNIWLACSSPKLLIAIIAMFRDQGFKVVANETDIAIVGLDGMRHRVILQK